MTKINLYNTQEFAKGPRNRLWSAEVTEDNTVKVTYGLEFGKMTTKEKAFETVEDAEKEIAKRIDKQIAKGYGPVTEEDLQVIETLEAQAIEKAEAKAKAEADKLAETDAKVEVDEVDEVVEDVEDVM